MPKDKDLVVPITVKDVIMVRTSVNILCNELIRRIKYDDALIEKCSDNMKQVVEQINREQLLR